MAKLTTEEEFNLRRQARRRLIGAIALVLVVVILLPIVFDSEPAPSKGNDIDLRIPGKDNAPEFQPKIDLPQLDKMASEVVAASPVVNAAPASAAVAVVPTPAPEKKPIAAAPAPVPNKPVAVAPVAKPKLEIKPKPEAKPKVESKPVAKPQAVPKTGFAVQVGAFANADAAKSLQAKLSKQGYHAYTEKAGNVVRVRIGGYPTREAAEKIQGKLEAQGTHSNVVNLE
jgi:DedD protein